MSSPGLVCFCWSALWKWGLVKLAKLHGRQGRTHHGHASPAATERTRASAWGQRLLLRSLCISRHSSEHVCTHNRRIRYRPVRIRKPFSREQLQYETLTLRFDLAPQIIPPTTQRHILSIWSWHDSLAGQERAGRDLWHHGTSKMLHGSCSPQSNQSRDPFTRAPNPPATHAIPVAWVYSSCSCTTAVEGRKQPNLATGCTLR